MATRIQLRRSFDEEASRDDLLQEVAELRRRLAACEACAREARREDLDRLRIAEELRASEELLRLALVGGRMGAWKWQLDTGKVAWSEEQFRLWGHKIGDFEPSYEAWHSRVHPDDIDRVEQEANGALAGKGDFLCEYRVVWPDGSVHWVEDRARIVRDEGGQALALHGVMLDIQHIKATEEALRESAQQQHALFKNSPLGTALVHPADFRFVKFNEKAHTMLGYSREEFARLTLFDLDATANPEEMRVKGEQLKEEKWLQFETLGRGRNGELHISLRGK